MPSQVRYTVDVTEVKDELEKFVFFEVLVFGVVCRASAISSQVYYTVDVTGSERSTKEVGLLKY